MSNEQLEREDLEYLMDSEQGERLGFRTKDEIEKMTLGELTRDILGLEITKLMISPKRRELRKSYNKYITMLHEQKKRADVLDGDAS